MANGQSSVVSYTSGLTQFNRSNSSYIAHCSRDPSVIATCTVACSQVMLSPGQNAHSLAYERRQTTSTCITDMHVIYLTAQIDNRVGAVQVTSPALIRLLCVA
jgi:hypothetical protein